MEVCWSPLHQDKFYTFGTNLNLYKVYQSQLSYSSNEAQDKDMRLSDDSKASLICTRNALQYRCISWRPHSGPDHLLAIGLNSGKVLLSSFGKGSISDPHGLSASEFNLKHPRACTYLEWNKQEPFLLAEVTEKLKTDGCILIWDVRYPNNQSASETSKLTNQNTPNDPSILANHNRPYVEIGVSESCSSFAWLHSNARSFVCGMNLKNLRIYDIRSPVEHFRPQHSTSTRAISLLSVHPSIHHYVASAYENQLFVWDLRMFNEAFDSIVEKMNFSKLSWCPTKPSLLACSFVDSPLLKLFDISLSSPGENKQRHKNEKILRPTSSGCHDDNISTFCWHPSHPSRLLVASTSGRISDLTAHDRMCMVWSPDLTLTCSVNRDVFVGVALVHEDMSINIRRRAFKQYGIKQRTQDNLPLVSQDKNLTSIWTWLSSIKPEHHPPPVQSPSTLEPPTLSINQSAGRNNSYAFLPTSSETGLHLPLLSASVHNHSLPQSPTVPHLPTLPSHPPPTHVPLSSALRQPVLNNACTRLSGLLSILQRPLNSSTTTLHWLTGSAIISPIPPSPKDPPIPPSPKEIPLSNQVFKSPERCLVLELCGWKVLSDNSMPLVDKLEEEGHVTRAAALCVFNIRLMPALHLLKKAAHEGLSGTEGDLNMLAMALAGFVGKEGKGGAWWNVCSQLKPCLHDPYVRALFSFLTDETGANDILHDNALELTDRIAFACLHLPDKQLLSFVEGQTSRHVQEGNPQGLILTGFNDSGIRLLSNYVDKSRDVQSAVLLLLQAMPEVDQLRGSNVLDGWVEDYRELLDKMGLWVERAEFDVFHMRVRKTNEKTRQIHMSCTFCNKPIVDSKTSGRSASSAAAQFKPRIQSCPHCRRPLPRCSVCLLFMGTASGIGCPRKASSKRERKLSCISDWFTWCQRCLHGGHAGHVLEWFKSRSVCPISGCNCRCDQLDSFSKRHSSRPDAYHDNKHHHDNDNNHHHDNANNHHHGDDIDRGKSIKSNFKVVTYNDSDVTPV